MNAAAAAPAPTTNFAAIHSVWHGNFDAESAQLLAVAPRAVHVAVSVQYPGCAVAQAGTGGQKKYGSLTAEKRYDMVKANIDELHPIQVGLAIRANDDDGDSGELVVFEFNLRGFDINNPADLRDPASIAHLRGRGVDFGRLPCAGVEPHRLRLLLLGSGLLQAWPSWATFTSAYHVGYLMKILTGAELPSGLDAFTAMATGTLGEGVYDVKRLAAEVNTACGFSLREIAVCIGVVPVAAQHGMVAGAGAVSTLQCFEALRERLGEARVAMHGQQLCGLRAY
ncbi:hypothetical protein EE612_033808 [Oryza sativa]|nr:hypothetical protein EE612_033808 [Oryza sativa]